MVVTIVLDSVEEELGAAVVVAAVDVGVVVVAAVDVEAVVAAVVVAALVEDACVVVTVVLGLAEEEEVIEVVVDSDVDAVVGDVTVRPHNSTFHARSTGASSSCVNCALGC